MAIREYRIRKTVEPVDVDARRWFWMVQLESRLPGERSWARAYHFDGGASDNGTVRSREKAVIRASIAEGRLRECAVRANALAMRKEHETRQEVIPL